jgi:transposase InsO family protein
MSQDEHTMKVFIPQLGHNVQYQNWRLSIEGALMTKGLIRYIRTALAGDAPVTDVDKRTQAFGIILSFLSFSERLAIEAILAAGTQDAHALWADIKRRHEKVDISRVWAHWRRLNSPPDATMSDSAAIDSWFTDTVAAYNAYKTSGRQIDEYTACLIMLDNLPVMWDSMRRSITQAGNADTAMTFAVLRGNMETELISRKPLADQPVPEMSQALLSMGNSRQQSGRKPSKRPRLVYQRTPGATCSKCKKANHTAQQCGKMVDKPDRQDDGAAQLTSSRRVNHELFDEDYDSDSGELHMAADSCDSSDDSSALATTKDSRSDLVPPSSHWLVDCGASHSYCNDRSLLSRARHCNAGVKLGNGHRLSVLAEGETTILLPPHGHKLTITVRYVPELKRNLLSAGALGRQGIHVLCAGPRAHIFHAQSKQEIGQARCINEGSEYNLYRIDPMHDTGPLHSALLSCQSNTDTEHDTATLWHRRLGHSNMRRIRQLFDKNTTADGHTLQSRIRLSTAQLQPERHCDSCAVCKQHAPSRPRSVSIDSRAKQPLATVHIDLRGPHSPGIKHELYQLLIVDECTRYAVGHTLKDKSESLTYFEQFATAANNFHSGSGYRIQFIRSDNGGEFIGKEWTPLLVRLGIQRHRTSPYTSHQNGIVERLNRTIGDSTRAMLHSAGLPDRFWPLACQAAVYINNRLPSKATGTATPYQLWHSKRPHIGHIRSFGCLAYALIHQPGKLDNRARRCTFVGYAPDSSHTYLLWDNQQHKLLRSGQVHFIESILGWNYNPRATAGEATAGEAAAGEEKSISQTLANRASQPGEAAPVPALLPLDVSPADVNIPADIDPAIDDAHDYQPPQPQPQQQPPSEQLNRAQRRLMRQLRDNLVPAARDAAPAASITDAMLQSNRPQLRIGPQQQHYYGSAHAAHQTADDTNDDEPRSYQQALDSSDRGAWLAAIRSELASLIKAQTWRYVRMPSTANLVGCKWVFKIKRDKDGHIHKFKARLVAQGFTQVYGIDYAETYAPVARYSSIRLIIALAAHYDWELHQMDVKTAYLNGELDVPIYMRAPDGLSLISQPCPADRVCLLIKCLYGLKQSGRRWHANINHSLLTHGFTPLHADRCVYVRRKAGDCIDIIALYVDDLLIASNKRSELLAIKRRLTQQYEMEDMGEATFILGIDIKRDRAQRSISIGQSAYINTLLRRHGMADCNPTSTPMDSAAASDLMAAAGGYEASLGLTRDYQSIIGGLMFAAICTRPDIAFAVNRLSRYCSNPTQEHYAAAKRILRYLKGTVELRITYTGSADRSPQLIGYCDADWAQDKDSKRKSTSGYVFVMCGGAISWQSKKQSTIALSSTQAELMAITSSTKELLWFRHHLGGIGLSRSQPTTLLVDSQCAMDIANNSRISDRSKHIEVQHFFIREHIEANTVRLQHIASDSQAADTLTKPLHRVAFKRCADMLGLSQRVDKVKVQRMQRPTMRRGEVLEQNGAQPAAHA